jgi:hypothetical protein
MPIINRAIPSNMPTRAAPITGDAIITKANTIAIDILSIEILNCILRIYYMSTIRTTFLNIMYVCCVYV